MYYENKIINDPPDKKSALEIYRELQNEFNKQKIDLKICSLYLKNKNEKHKEKGDDQFQNQWKNFMTNNTYWWDNQYQLALNGKDIKKINQIIHPQLLNEIPPFLAKYQDYYQLIEQILQKTQEELFAVPTHNPLVTSTNTIIIPSNEQQNDCHIKLLGKKEDFNKLKQIDNQLYIFGELVQINNSLQNTNTQFFNKQSFKLDQYNNTGFVINDLERHNTNTKVKGSDFQFGYKTTQHNTNKFHIFWALDQIRKHYPQQVDIENPILQIQGNIARIYFELLINSVRRIHFKIEFLLTKGQNKKMIKGNLCHSDGSVIIEKEKDIMHFYLRVQNYPKCYISESLKLDEYHEPQYREWWRCQNFILNDMANIVVKSILKNSYLIRFSVTDFENKDFLEFCQMIEKEGFLQQYHPSKIFLLKKFSDLELQKYIYPIQLDLNWALISAIFGRVKLIQPSFSIEKFMEQFQKYDQGQLAQIINNLRKKGVTNTLTQNDFHQLLEQLINDLVITKQKTIMQGFITPSQIIPNYQINEYFPLIETNILLYQNRNKLKTMSVRTSLIKFSLRDDSLLKITQRQLDIPQHFQNKILIDAYFRTLLKKDLKIMDHTFEFIGFSSKSLKNNECYFVNSQIAYIIKQSLFSKLGYISSKLDCAVKCRHFQRILDEFFQSISKIVRFQELSPVLGDQIIRIKKTSKHPNKKMENIYGFRVLKPQGKITQDLMSKITDDNQSCVFVRWKSYTGILVASKNPNKQSQITLYEAMEEQQSPSSELYFQPEELNLNLPHCKQIDLQNLHLNYSTVQELQIIALPKHRPCILELHHVLNIYNENLRIYVRSYYGMYSNQNQVQKLQKKLTQYYTEMKQKCPKLAKYRNEFRLPIKKGAYLTAVYDSRLSPEEIFVQIDNKVVKGKEIMVFKKKYLLDDGVQVFSSVEDGDIKESLKQQYRNVIVFSTHFICSRFAFDQFDQKQRFFAIWDPLLMVQKSEIYPIDCEITYNKLKYLSFSILNDSLHSNYKEVGDQNIEQYDFKGWLPVLYNQLIDYFTLFQSSQNIQELKQMYCTIKIAMTLNEYLYKTKQEQFTSALQQIQLANYQYLWYADTQASPPIFPRKIREIFEMVNYGDINDMVQLLFLD